MTSFVEILSSIDVDQGKAMQLKCLIKRLLYQSLCSYRYLLQKDN